MVRALAAWAGVYKPKASEKPSSQDRTMETLRAMFPSGKIG